MTEGRITQIHKIRIIKTKFEWNLIINCTRTYGIGDWREWYAIDDNIVIKTKTDFIIWLLTTDKSPCNDQNSSYFDLDIFLNKCRCFTNDNIIDIKLLIATSKL